VTIELIDVSQFNGKIDYARVAASGIAGAYVRALVGLGTVDERLYEHANGFRSAGVPFGVYGDDFPRHGRPQDADKQADQLADLSNEVGAPLVPMVDVEPEGVALVTGAEWAASVESYVTRLEARVGRPPLAYTGPVFWSAYPELRMCCAAARCPLWLASYTDGMPSAPAPWGRLLLWQYQGGGPTLPARFRGRCDGITGDVDRSSLFGELADLEVA
jgi:GH25 family lysozyme M1 (1,4-beta-N-acetylmuramidase)